VILGQQLMDADFIHHVHDAHTFKDDNLFYRFREDEDNSSKGPSVAKVLKEGVVAIEGVLDVKSGLFWNKRYFVLRADEVKLYYFETNLSSAPSRIIDLSNSELEVAECSCKTGSYCFTIKEKKRSYVLCTDHSKVQLAWLQALTELGVKFLEEKIDPMGNSIFDFNANDIDGNHCPLAKFAGNVCLVVNVASYWGLTDVHYEQLQGLYLELHDQGFEILAFPCNQFGRQEPKSNKEIKQFVVDKGATFPLFEKIYVNGKKAHPIYNFLRAKIGGIMGSSIKWNFTKFLCDRNGIPIERYSPPTKPYDIKNDILELLKKQ